MLFLDDGWKVQGFIKSITLTCRPQDIFIEKIIMCFGIWKALSPFQLLGDFGSPFQRLHLGVAVQIIKHHLRSDKFPRRIIASYSFIFLKCIYRVPCNAISFFYCS